MNTVSSSITIFLFTLFFIFFSFTKKDNSLAMWLMIAILITMSLSFIPNKNYVYYAQ